MGKIKVFKVFAAVFVAASLAWAQGSPNFAFPSPLPPTGDTAGIKQIVSFIWDGSCYSGKMGSTYEGPNTSDFATMNYVGGVREEGDFRTTGPNELNLQEGSMGVTWAALTLAGHEAVQVMPWNAMFAYNVGNEVTYQGYLWRARAWTGAGVVPVDDPGGQSWEPGWERVRPLGGGIPSRRNPDGSNISMTFNAISGVFVPTAPLDSFASRESKYGFWRPNQEFYPQGIPSSSMHNRIAVTWGREQAIYMTAAEMGSPTGRRGVAGHIENAFRDLLAVGHEVGNHTIDNMETISPLPHSVGNAYPAMAMAPGNPSGTAFMDGFGRWGGEGMTDGGRVCSVTLPDGQTLSIDKVMNFGQRPGSALQYMGWKYSAGRVLSINAWQGLIQLGEEELTAALEISRTNGGVSGFRAPRMEVNSNMFHALRNLNYLYDMSIEEGYEYNINGTNFLWPYTMDNGSPNMAWQRMNGANVSNWDSLPSGLWQYPVSTFIVPENHRQGVWSNYQAISIANGVSLSEADRQQFLKHGKIRGTSFDLFILHGATRTQATETLRHTLNLRMAGGRAPFQIASNSDHFTPIFDNTTLRGSSYSLVVTNGWNTWQNRIDAYEDFVGYGHSLGAHFWDGKKTIEYVRSLAAQATHGQAATPINNWTFFSRGGKSTAIGNLADGAEITTVQTVSDNNIEISGFLAPINFSSAGFDHISLQYSTSAPITIRLITNDPLDQMYPYEVTLSNLNGFNNWDGSRSVNQNRFVNSNRIPLTAFQRNQRVALNDNFISEVGLNAPDTDFSKTVTAIEVVVQTPLLSSLRPDIRGRAADQKNTLAVRNFVIHGDELGDNGGGTDPCALGHSFGGWITTVPVTDIRNGVERRTCQINGCDHFEEQPILATGVSTSPVQLITPTSTWEIHEGPMTTVEFLSGENGGVLHGRVTMPADIGNGGGVWPIGLFTSNEIHRFVGLESIEIEYEAIDTWRIELGIPALSSDGLNYRADLQQGSRSVTIPISAFSKPTWGGTQFAANNVVPYLDQVVWFSVVAVSGAAKTCEITIHSIVLNFNDGDNGGGGGKIWNSDATPTVSDGDTIVIAAGAAGVLSVPGGATVFIISEGEVVNYVAIGIFTDLSTRVIWGARYYGSAITFSGGGELVIANGAKIVSSASAIEVSGSGSIVVNGGEITGGDGEAILSDVNRPANVEITVNGGEINGRITGSQITINDGAINGSLRIYGIATIRGGTITADNTAITTFWSNNHIAITGGNIIFTGNDVVAFVGTFDNISIACDVNVNVGNGIISSHPINTTHNDVDNWTVVTPATCGSQGLETGLCNHCGETANRSTPRSGDHVFGVWTIDYPATCNQDGWELATCTVDGCYERIGRSIPQLTEADGCCVNHVLGTWTISSPATCIGNGWETAHCTVDGCDYSEGRPIPRLRGAENDCQVYSVDFAKERDWQALGNIVVKNKTADGFTFEMNHIPNDPNDPVTVSAWAGIVLGRSTSWDSSERWNSIESFTITYTSNDSIMIGVSNSNSWGPTHRAALPPTTNSTVTLNLSDFVDWGGNPLDSVHNQIWILPMGPERPTNGEIFAFIANAWSPIDVTPPCNHSWTWVVVTPATCDSAGLERRTCSVCAGYQELEIPQLICSGEYLEIIGWQGTSWISEADHYGSSVQIISSSPLQAQMNLVPNDPANHIWPFTLIGTFFQDRFFDSLTAIEVTYTSNDTVRINIGSKVTLQNDPIDYFAVLPPAPGGNTIALPLSAFEAPEWMWNQAWGGSADVIRYLSYVAKANIVSGISFRHENYGQTLDLTVTSLKLHGITPSDPTCNHDWTWVVVTPATCDSAGLERRTCSICSYGYQEREIPQLTHDWSGWAEALAPTCEVEGTEKRTCSLCSEEETRSIAALDHDMPDGWTEETAATCLTAGEERKTCLRAGCTHFESQEIPAFGHNWDEWVIRPATCIATGDSTRTCIRGDSTEVRVIAMLGHDMPDNWAVETAATCLTAGEERKTCLRAGCAHFESQEIAASGHLLGDWAIGTPATCTTPGDSIRSCTIANCTHSESLPIPAFGHNWGEWVITPATCIATGDSTRTCTRGDSTEVRVIAMLEHNLPATWTVRRAPACDITGLNYKKCAHCDHEEIDTIPALAHNMSDDWTVRELPTCTTPGDSIRVCTRDNCTHSETLPIPALGHNMPNDWTITTPESCSVAGEERRTCQRTGCSHVETQPRPVLPHTWSNVWVVQLPATVREPGREFTVCVIDGCNERQFRDIDRLSLNTTNIDVVWSDDTVFVFNGGVQAPSTMVSANGVPLAFTILGGATNVGQHTARIRLVEDETIVPDNDEIVFRITPAPITPILSARSATVRDVNELEAGLGIIGNSGNGDRTLEYSRNEDGPWVTLKPTTPGIHFVRAVIPSTQNFLGATTEPLGFAILAPNPTTVDVNWNANTLSFVFDGNVHTPEATVSHTGEDSIRRTINLIVSGAINAGTHRATARLETPDEAFVFDTTLANPNSTVREFRILPGAITPNMISPVTDFIYADGEEIRPQITVRDGDRILAEGVDYRVEYLNNDRVGTATARIIGLNNSELSGSGNYTGEQTVTFRIFAPTQEITFGFVEWGTTEFEFDGYPKKPMATVKDIDGNIILTDVVGEQTDAGDYVAMIRARNVPDNDGKFFAFDEPLMPFTISPKKLAVNWFAPREDNLRLPNLTEPWESGGEFTFNKMRQAPVPTVAAANIDVFVTNPRSRADDHTARAAIRLPMAQGLNVRNYVLDEDEIDYKIVPSELEVTVSFETTETIECPLGNREEIIGRFSNQAELEAYLDTAALLNFTGFMTDTTGLRDVTDNESVLEGRLPRITIEPLPQTQAQMSSFYQSSQISQSSSSRMGRSLELMRYRLYLLTIEAGNNLAENYILRISDTIGVGFLAYEVEFVGYNNELVKSDTVFAGEAAVPPADPTRDGYNFTGWDIEFNNVVANLTVRATWTRSTSIRNNANDNNRYGILLENAIVSDVARISVITPEPATANITIVDNLGNVVWTVNGVGANHHSPNMHGDFPQHGGDIWAKNVSPLQNAIVWDLTNNNGRFVANGTYLIVVEATGVSGKRFVYSTRVGVNR